MISIFKREWKGYFCGLFGWAMLAMMTLTGGLITLVACYLSFSTSFSSVFSTLSMFLCLYVPILAAYTYSDEQVNKNTRWLDSLPIRWSHIFIGKYLAALALLTVPCALLVFVPLLLANHGTVSFGSSYVGLLGYWLLGATLLAVCSPVALKIRKKWISSLVGLVLCVAVFFLPLLATVCEALPWLGLVILVVLCAIVGTVVGLLRRRVLLGLLVAGIPSAVLGALCLIPNFYENILSTIILNVSVFSRLSGLLSGRIDLPAIGLYLSLIALFLGLPILFHAMPRASLKKKLTDRRSIFAAALAILLVAVNLLLPLLPFRAAYADVSGNDTYTLSDTSRRYLATLDEDVEIVYYSYGGKANADRDLYSFVLQYASASPRVSVRVEDPAKLGLPVYDQSIYIRTEKRARLLLISELYYYYNSPTYSMHTMSEYVQLLQTLSENKGNSSYDQMSKAYSGNNTIAYFTGDANITGAIRYVTAERAPAIYVYGKGTTESINQFLRHYLEQNAYCVLGLEGLDSIPADCDTLMLSIATDLTDEEASDLSAYLANGGTLLLTTAYTINSTPNLSAVLSTYGLAIPDEMSLIYDASSASQIFYATEGAYHPVTDLYSQSFVAAFAHQILVSDTEGVSQTVLLQSPGTSVVIKQNSGVSAQGSYPICVLAEKDSSRVIWLSMMPDSYLHGISAGADSTFIENTLQWSTDYVSSALSIPEGEVPSQYLTVTYRALIAFVVVFIALPPIVSLTIGLVRRYLRNKK